jgi:SAM-dependent methyltransferase
VNESPVTSASESAAPESARKQRIRALADSLAPERERWIERNAYYYDEDYRYTRFLVPAGSRILDLGCGTGRLLASLRPARGVGVDLSPKMVGEARRRHPDLEFHVGDIEDPEVLDALPGPFDVILLSDTVGTSSTGCATATPGS